MNSPLLRALSLLILIAFVVFINAPAAQADHKWQYVGILIQRAGEEVGSIAVSPNGSQIAVVFNNTFGPRGGNKAHIELVSSDQKELLTFEIPLELKTYADFRDLEFSPSGALLYAWTGNDRYVRVWQVSNGKYLGKYGDGIYGGVGFGLNQANPDTNTFGESPSSGSTALPPLLAQAGGGTNVNVHIRDAKNVKIGTAKAGNDSVTDIDYAPNSSFIAIGGWDGYAYLAYPSRTSTWSVKPLKPNIGSVRMVDVDSSSKRIAASSINKIVSIWDTSGKQLKQFSGHKGIVGDVRFSAYGNYLVSGSNDKTAKVWNVSATDPKQWKAEDSLPNGGNVGAVGMSPDRDMTTIYTGSSDGIVKIWRKAGATPAPSSSPTPTPTPTPSSNPSPTPDPTSTILPTPTSTPTPTPTITFSPTPSPTPTVTVSPTPTFTPTPTPTLSPSPTISP